MMIPQKIFITAILLALLISVQSVTAQQNGQPAAVPVDVVDFVTRVYPHGVPYEQAIRYSGNDVTVLLDMLDDNRYAQYRSNIVSTLGFIGSSRAVLPLVYFIQVGSGVIDAEQYRAKAAAIISLGYLINRNANATALDYLKGGIEPNVWSKRKIRWTTAFFPDETSRNIELAKQSLIALGLSGHPEATAILREQQSRPQQRSAAALSDNLLDELLKANEEIARDGLGEYYQQE